MHKDSNLKESLVGVITPRLTKKALNNLPNDYIKQVLALLTEQKEQGKIDKIYSKRYIGMVKNEEDGVFNEGVMNALVTVGLANIEKRKKFGVKTKKTTKTN